MLQLCFPVNNKVQTTFTLILVSDKNKCELVDNLNQTSKKLKLLCFFFLLFYVRTINLGKVGEKQSSMSLSLVKIVTPSQISLSYMALMVDCFNLFI